MLIVAIPKSASTSLLKTLAEAHNFESHQLIFKDFERPADYEILPRYHSDFRELRDDIVFQFKEDVLFKQHIPPTQNNLNLLKGTKKVVLLRKPEEIIEAYYRATMKRIHEPRAEFEEVKSLDEWKERAKKIGLEQDLNRFYNTWLEQEDTLVVYYDEVVSNVSSVINQIEEYFGLPHTKNEVILAKERYSRSGIFTSYLQYVKRVIMSFLHSFKSK